jgi:HJR/Mrr/RecB family endonuclease
MGTVLAVYSEVQRRFISCAQKVELTPEGVRYYLSTPFRYCIGDKYLYVPAAGRDESEKLKLSWARIKSHMINQIEVVRWDSKIEKTYDLESFEGDGLYVGNRYMKRQREVKGRFVAVDEFCSQTLIDGLAQNPEALPTVSKDDFESLCAELFVRRGFKVDLFRPTKDGGIDFLALQDDVSDPIIFAVQCKLPDDREGKRRKSVGRPTLQQIYGAAKAWDLTGGIVVSGSTYSTEAKNFSSLKPTEMKLYSQNDILEWITKYRWNEDEGP